MEPLSPNSEGIRSALREVDANLRDVQKLCSLKTSKVKGISEEVMKFRSQIQEWYTKLERNSPTSPHLIRMQSEKDRSVESIPILSPVGSPQSDQASPPVRGRAQASPPLATTPVQESSSDSSFPPTPKMVATPSTCDVLGRKKSSRNREASGLGGGADPCLTPEFPTLTPAGMKVRSERKSLDSLDCLSMGSPPTPQLDSTPTTTIQLSPSHLAYLALEGGEATAAEEKRGVDTQDVEDKLMNSLYVVS
ncbi:hypothetical protein HOP50_15g75310 [Chloropicon primus]|uniref:Uncharacterized protein n=1 Tax=Chloropicon primus TaxID=1764295 RepID=A0A5B8MW01_9CHLO|nr:hypothetical protein A3770_15p75060 [Chloropicon primus]UPR04197.1 hypothetical protein HOP50_15g75310 [Chloropicon primus]|mmetsp:Transcript_1948/g.5294  ORF Transcript_1948/g.5294 Transcript_1948/m.5294 type:complete len:250 (-) Transcript_1948:32-781(-)|eukprot:QDZ24988.1 hypothetical protein A3770_15p75060 [Chloropicon primus]